MTVALEVLNVKIFDGEFEWAQVSLRAYCVFLLSYVFVFVFCRLVRNAKRNPRSTAATWRRRGSGRWRAGTRCVRVSLCVRVGMRVSVCARVSVCHMLRCLLLLFQRYFMLDKGIFTYAKSSNDVSTPALKLCNMSGMSTWAYLM